MWLLFISTESCVPRLSVLLRFVDWLRRSSLAFLHNSSQFSSPISPPSVVSPIELDFFGWTDGGININRHLVQLCTFFFTIRVGCSHHIQFPASFTALNWWTWNVSNCVKIKDIFTPEPLVHYNQSRVWSQPFMWFWIHSGKRWCVKNELDRDQLFKAVSVCFQMNSGSVYF